MDKAIDTPAADTDALGWLYGERTDGTPRKFSERQLGAAFFKDIDFFYGGETANGHPDHGPAFNAAIAAGEYRLTAKPGKTLYFSTSIDLPTGTESVSFVAPLTDIELYAADGMFKSGKLQQGKFIVRNLTCRAGSGHVFSGLSFLNSSDIHVQNLTMVANPTKSFLYGSDVGGVQMQCYDNRISIRYARRTSNATAISSAPYIESVGTTNYFRGNIIEFGFAYGSSDNPLVKIDMNNVGNAVNCGNIYRFMTAEICAGGIIHLSSEVASKIEAYSYDMQVNAITNHAIILAQSSAIPCRGIGVKYYRTAGSMSGAGFVDVDLVGARECDIHVVSTSSGSLRGIIDAHSFAHTVHTDVNTLVNNDSAVRYV